MLRLEGSVIRHLEPLQGKTIPRLLAAGPCLEGVIVVTEYIEGRYDTFSLHCQCKILLNTIGSPSPLSGRAHLLACCGLLAIQHGTARLAIVTYLLLCNVAARIHSEGCMGHLLIPMSMQSCNFFVAGTWIAPPQSTGRCCLWPGRSCAPSTRTVSCMGICVLTISSSPLPTT